jgi:putative copper resistance protein D
VAAAAMAWAGHAVAVEPLGPVAVLADALHLLAAGCWLGALLPLALLLRAASRESGADARPYAVLAVRRFSAFSLVAMLLIVATGLWNAWTEVGSLAALVGTRYGWLLLVKIALLGPILAFALANRRRLLPALSGDAATVGRPAMARLSRFIVCELALALLVLAVTAALSLTVPGAHDVVWWPFPYRLSYDAATAQQGLDARLLIGGQLAFLGLLAALVAWLLERRRGFLAALGGLALLSGGWIALPPLAVDAYPTTYRRSPMFYEAGSIAEGAALYAAHCATCHGPGGKGDGPGGAALPKHPADLTGPRAAKPTAGDLFWRITHGIRASGMPAFGETLSEDERWDLINFLRALASGVEARALTPLVERDRPRVVAPDFSYAVGPTPQRTLKEFRGRSMVLVVLFSLPGSRQRVDQLAGAYEAINVSGAEIVAVPMDADPSIIRRLGATPLVLFPVVTEGAAQIVRAYSLFSRTPDSPAPRHAEFLVDRQGYIRARWIPGVRGTGWEDLSILGAEIRALATEKPPARVPDEHVH